MTTNKPTRQDCLNQWNLILDLESQITCQQANYDSQLSRIRSKEDMALYAPKIHIGQAQAELESLKNSLTEARSTLGQMLR